MSERRYLEIGHTGEAFHEVYLSAPPPKEVFYCDCEGVGRLTWHPLNVPIDDAGAPISLQDWITQHQSHGIRRQIFVDVSKRPEAKLGMIYDEDSTEFTDAPTPNKPPSFQDNIAAIKAKLGL